MKKKWLITGISIIVVILLTLTSLSNVVGYQTVQTSQENLIKERINQRELLFQTIVDIANNKEIQRIILKSQMNRGIFPQSEFPDVTKNQIRQMYFLGIILSKVVSKSSIQSIAGKYQFSNQEIQKEITAVIEKDAIINSEITQLQDSECDCENEKEINWTFPVLCTILFFIFLPLFLPLLLLGYSILFIGMGIMFSNFYHYTDFETFLFILGWAIMGVGGFVAAGPFIIGKKFNCWWARGFGW
jgi:hypothetical protein